MNDRISVKSDQQIVSTEAGLAATIGFASQRPVGGEMFFLTAPLQKPSSIMDHRDLETQFGCSLGEELDLLSAVSLLVVLSAFINVSLTVL
jgi:hypothetical protein